MDNTSSNLSNFSSSVQLSPASTSVGTDVLAFQSCVVVIAIVGLTANGLTLLAMAQSKQIANRKLLVVQLLIDFLQCILLALTYLLKFPRFVYANTGWNFFLCVMFVDGESAVWVLNNVSTANLVAIAIERYVMIVHSVWHRNHFKPWMIDVGIVCTWIYGTLMTLPTNFLTSYVDANGSCKVQARWASWGWKQFRNVVFFSLIYVIPISVFVFCYSSIVFVVKRQMNAVSKGALNQSATAQMNALKRQMALVNTLILIVTCFFLFYSPLRWYFAAAAFLGVSPVGNATRFATVFLAFFDVCLSPFLYAATLDAVKKYIRSRFRSEFHHERDCPGRCVDSLTLPPVIVERMG